MLELHVLVAIVKQPLVEFLRSTYAQYMTAVEARSPQRFAVGRPTLDAAAANGRLLIRDRFHQRQFEKHLQSLVRHCPGAATTRDLVDCSRRRLRRAARRRSAGHERPAERVGSPAVPEGIRQCYSMFGLVVRCERCRPPSSECSNTHSSRGHRSRRCTRRW